MSASIPADSFRFLPFVRVPAAALLWAAFTGMALVLPALYLIQFLPLPVRPGQAAAAAARAASLPVWGLALKAVILYPLIEEGFYRGVVLQLLRRYLPLWLALVPPNLLFAVSHLGFSVQNAVFAGVAGLLFSWLMIRSRSLLPAIVCHAGINLFFVFLLRPLFDGTTATGTAAFHRPLPLLILAVSLAALIFGVRRLQSRLRPAPALPGGPAADRSVLAGSPAR